MDVVLALYFGLLAAAMVIGICVSLHLWYSAYRSWKDKRDFIARLRKRK